MSMDSFAEQSHILHRALQHPYQKIVSGAGSNLLLESGQSIIDASCGPSVSCLGHHQPEVAETIYEQVNDIAYVYSGSPFASHPSEELASLLLSHHPGGLSKAIFVNSGSEATDAALKLATQYWQEIGKPSKQHFISRKQSYHGNTLGALSVSGHDSRRALYQHWLSSNVSFVDPCYAFRGKKTGETDENYVQRLAMQLESEILRVGPERVAAFIAEPISGTSLGCVPAVPGYFRAVRGICDKYDVLLVLDEIMCGMGKTGTMHAWEQEGIRGPDIQTIGKALGGGFVPLSGVLVHQRIFDAIGAGSRTLMHGHTFQAHPTACAAAVQVQKIIARDNLLDRVRERGAYLEQLLRQHVGCMSFVADIRGRGLFWAVEFLRDPRSKTTFSVEDQFSNRVVAQALKHGLNILGNLGVTGELYIDHVIVAPAYIIENFELEEIVCRLAKAINEVSADVSLVSRDSGEEIYRPGKARL